MKAERSISRNNIVRHNAQPNHKQSPPGGISEGFCYVKPRVGGFSPASARDFVIKKATPLTLPTRSSINARIFGATVKRCCFAKYNFNYVLKFVLALTKKYLYGWGSNDEGQIGQKVNYKTKYDSSGVLMFKKTSTRSYYFETKPRAISIHNMEVDSLRDIIKFTPLDRLLVETDSPYLAPVPNRGKRNDSSNIRYVIEKLAEIKKCTPEEIVRATEENARRLYRLP